MLDGDGDHDYATAGEAQSYGMLHDPSSLAHEPHEHLHTGRYDNSHEHGGPHLHEDGSSHEHPHLHRHDHHDHHASNRAMGDAGHSHLHGHHHAHGHYYRIADGAALDERMVSGEQLRTREYVSSAAFLAAGGVEGRGLSADQYRVAAGVESRLEAQAAEERARGPFSRNPYGAAEIGTPAEAEAPAEQTHDELRDGRVRQLDRDGQPMNPELPEPARNGGTDDQSAAPSGFAQLTDGASDGRSVSGIAAVVERVLSAAVQPLAQRLAALESQPQAGGPIFNGAAMPVEKRNALTPGAAAESVNPGNPGNQPSGPSVEERIAALREVAARVSDPGLQVELATQIILLQQEGKGPSIPAMPLAGNGAMPRPRQRW